MFSFLILSMIHMQQTMEIVAQQREREIEIARAKDRDRLARQKKKMKWDSSHCSFLLVDQKSQSGNDVVDCVA
jgi:hypothetical protein